MRYLVLTLGILGGLVAAALGMNWIGQYNDLQDLISRPDMAEVVAAADMQNQIAKTTSLMRASYVLIAGLFLGIAGGVMGMRRSGKIAGSLMLAAPVVAAVMAPTTLVASFLLIIGGALAFRLKAS
jgi:hypothetical protein